MLNSFVRCFCCCSSKAPINNQLINSRIIIKQHFQHQLKKTDSIFFTSAQHCFQRQSSSNSNPQIVSHCSYHHRNTKLINCSSRYKPQQLLNFSTSSSSSSSSYVITNSADPLNVDTSTQPGGSGGILYPGPGAGGIEGPPRNPPSHVEQEEIQRNEKNEPVLGQASAPPPFDPSDPEEKKNRRAAAWGEEPPKQREESLGRGSTAGAVQLTEESCSIRFMINRLKTPPAIIDSAAAAGQQSSRKKRLLDDINNKTLFVPPVIRRLVPEYQAGLTAAIKQIAKAFESPSNLEFFKNSVGNLLNQSINEVTKELIQADAKLVFGITEIRSTRLSRVDIVTSDGVIHDVLNGDFPFLQLIRDSNDSCVLQFEGFVECSQVVYVENMKTNEVLFGSSKETDIVTHRLKFKSTMKRLLPAFPTSFAYADLLACSSNFANFGFWELIKLASNPWRISSWILEDFNGEKEFKQIKDEKDSK